MGFVYHEKCGLPIELCACGENDSPHIVRGVHCTLCGKEWIAVVAPGVPICDYECPKCEKRGYVKEV